MMLYYSKVDLDAVLGGSRIGTGKGKERALGISLA